MKQEIFDQYGFELSSSEKKSFERYLELFMDYNSHTNLSAIRDEEGIVEKHFVDSLYGANIIVESYEWGPRGAWVRRLLDIGSWGGFPGIPLKIVLPELEVTLLDSVGKKVKAMNFFVEQLGLEHIHAIQERAEMLAKDSKHRENYDFVVSRATAYITDILSWATPFLKPDGKIILYKMPSEDEMRDLRKILKKFSLVLEWELPYALWGKERIVLSFKRK